MKFSKRMIMATDMQNPSVPQQASPTVDSQPARRAQPIKAQVWRLNSRRLLWTFAVAVVVAPLLYFWYDYQHGRNANILLARGRALHEQEDWRAASAAFDKYLRLRPDDPEALVLRAQNFDKLAVQRERKRQAASLYLQAIQAHKTDRYDLRLRQAELLYESGSFHDAATEANDIRQALASQTPPPPELLAARRVYAEALREQIGLGGGKPVGEVVREFESALKEYPGDIKLSIGLAGLLATRYADSLAGELRVAAFRRAEQVVDEVVSRNPGDVQALLARYGFHTALGMSEQDKKQQVRHQDIRDADLKELLKTAPDDPNVLMAAASNVADKAGTDSQRAGLEKDAAEVTRLQASAAKKRAEAREYATQLLKVAPKYRSGYFMVATLHTRWNELQDAIDVLKTALARFGVDDLELNHRLLQLYLTVNDLVEARTVLARIEPVVRRYTRSARVRGWLAEDLELAAARIQDLEGKTVQVLPRLKRLATSVTERDDPRDTLEERQRRWRLVANAYSRLGQHDLSAKTYDELILLDPRSQVDQLQAGVEWRASGDLDRAIKRFEAATASETAVPGAWLALAKARLDQQLRNPVAACRNWRDLEAAIKQARLHLGDSPAIILLEATAAIARNNREVAFDQLKAFATADKIEATQLPRVAILLQNAGGNAEADAALERYRASARSPVEFAVVKSEVLNGRGETALAVETLEQVLDQASDGERSAIIRRVIGLEIELGSMRSARARLGKLRDAKSDSLWVYETAADLAIVADDPADLEKCEIEVKDVEGEDSGTLWRYFRAVRLLDTAGENSNGVAEAESLLAEIKTARPAWPQINVLRGILAERSSQDETAVKSYELALRFGAGNLTTMHRLGAVLYRHKGEGGGFADLDEFIQRMGPMAAFAGEFASDVVPARLQRGRLGDALRISRATAELRPNDPAACVMYAQCLALDNKSRDAEAAFRKATKLAPADIRTWSGLISFYSRERRQAEARQALNELLSHVKLEQYEQDLVKARAWDIIGDRPRAEQQYLRLLAENQTNLKLFEEVGRFFLRFDHDRALDIFQQALKLDPQSTEARRQIAILLGQRGGDADLGRALELLGQGNEAAAVEDRRMQASLLLLRGGDERCRQAVELLTSQIESADKPAADDRLLLAKAYNDLGQLDLAQEQYETLLKAQNEPLYQAMFVRFLNRHDRLTPADLWLTRLEQAKSGDPQVLELRVDWLKRSKRIDEIEKTVDGFLAPRLRTAKNVTQQTALLRYAAGLFSAEKLDEAAEKKFREIVRLVPANYEPLAVWLAERGRIDEALALCREKPSDVDAGLAAITLVRVLTVAVCYHTEKSFDSSAAEGAIAAAGAAQDAKFQLLLELGVLRAMQGRNAEAISIYERLLTQTPDNPVVMNNLAVVLVEIAERQEEALRSIDKVIAAAPDKPEFLDTKGLVLAGVARFSEAREIFDRLCRSSPKNPQYHLHLAMTLSHLGDAPTSRQHGKIAIDNQIDKEFLTPAERRFVQELKADLADQDRSTR